MAFVKEQLKIVIDKVFLWTDSQVVIGWINSDKVLPVFVNNRIKEIKAHPDVEISYINTVENPADIGTRGSTMIRLWENQLLWHGPKWLENPVDKWLVGKCSMTNLVVDKENEDADSIEQPPTIGEMNCLCASLTDSPLGINCNRFSSLTKLLRVTALALRFIRKLKRKTFECDINSKEIKEAENMWLKHVQQKHFAQEIYCIPRNTSTSLQRNLGLYLDTEGLLRCSGRLDNAELEEGARRPTLLPTKDQFTSLMIEKVHKECLHFGVSQTLAKIRYRFWIPKGRSIVKSVIRLCRICRHHEGGPYKMPPMAQLPSSRIQESPAFSKTGVDYFGPLKVKSSSEVKKTWICLYTCMVTRAIHLEVMQDMSAEEFILRLKRFISMRGTSVMCLSDNAAQFKLASKVIETSGTKQWKVLMCKPMCRNKDFSGSLIRNWHHGWVFFMNDW